MQSSVLTLCPNLLSPGELVLIFVGLAVAILCFEMARRLLRRTIKANELFIGAPGQDPVRRATVDGLRLASVAFPSRHCCERFLWLLFLPCCFRSRYYEFASRWLSGFPLRPRPQRPRKALRWPARDPGGPSGPQPCSLVLWALDSEGIQLPTGLTPLKRSCGLVCHSTLMAGIPLPCTST